MKKLTTFALLTAISIFTAFSLSASQGTIANWNIEHDDSLKQSSSSDCHKHFDSDFYTKKTFAATFSGASNVTPEIVDQAWAYYLNQNWPKLNELFVSNDIASRTIIWPPANGGFNTTGDVHFKKGQMYDRYGKNSGMDANGVPILTGSFTSPIIDDRPFSYGQRALEGTKDSYDYYYTIEIVEDLEFTCEEADVIPWFKQPGLAIQEKWNIPKDPNSAKGYNYSYTQLAQMGLIRITIVSSPSGKFSKLAGMVIEKK
ncbi:MAG: glycohydrolase toxin TNT-related protein [Crocinitomicaceae bacterium]|nr:glycohydrolase toxin TNT-related protein [Crocinitomicaceae bacterium]